MYRINIHQYALKYESISFESTRRGQRFEVYSQRTKCQFSKCREENYIIRNTSRRNKDGDLPGQSMYD